MQSRSGIVGILMKRVLHNQPTRLAWMVEVFCTRDGMCDFELSKPILGYLLLLHPRTDCLQTRAVAHMKAALL